MSGMHPGRSRLPAIVFAWLVVAFALLPLGIMFMMSFSSSEFVRFPPPGYSLRWYEAYFNSGDWVEATIRSLVLGVVVSALSVVLGVPASLAIDRMGGRSANATLAVVTLPIILPPVVIAVAMYMTFSKLGLVGTYAGLVVGHLTLALPFVVFTTLASLRGLGPEYYRAGLSLGASRTRVVMTVVLPMIRPGILSGAQLAFLTSFDELLISLFIGNPTIRTLPRRMWDGVRSEFAAEATAGRASAAAAVRTTRALVMKISVSVIVPIFAYGVNMD